MPNTIVIAGRILLVDDQPANLRVVTTLLKRQGYEVATAADGSFVIVWVRYGQDGDATAAKASRTFSIASSAVSQSQPPWERGD